MIDFLVQLWSAIFLPLTWMPSFCQEVCAVVLSVVTILTVIAFIVKIVPNAIQFFLGG